MPSVSAVERIVPALGGLVAFGVPTGYFLWQVWLSYRSRSWPSTTGRVLLSERHWEFVPMSRTHLKPRILYEYRVDGRRYTGRRVTFGGWLHTNVSVTGRVLNRYRPGSPVSVRYDPRKPSRCTLERRLSRIVWLFVGIGLLMMSSIFGALMGWWE